MFLRCAIGSLEHQGKESLTNRRGDLSFLASVKAALEDKHVWNGEKNFSITALNLLFEEGVLFTGSLDKLRETNELLSLIPWHQMSTTEAPSLFKASDEVDKLWIVS